MGRYTEIVIVVVRELIAFTARIVATLLVTEAVGMPEITPVALFRVRPTGRKPLSKEKESTFVFTDGLVEKDCDREME